MVNLTSTQTWAPLYQWWSTNIWSKFFYFFSLVLWILECQNKFPWSYIVSMKSVMLKLILKHEIQSSLIENIERIVYWLHDQKKLMKSYQFEREDFYLMWCNLLNSNTCWCCLGRQKHSNYIYDDWKVMIWKKFGVKLSTWRTTW
jgi:hypothetical protein